MTADELVQLELMLNRFRRLITELIRGTLRRNAFEPWEIEILLDLEACGMHTLRLKTLRAYQKAVEHQMETGPGPPMKYSEYLRRKDAASFHRKMTRRPATSKAPPSTSRIASE